jgi:hypothetical protein
MVAVLVGGALLVACSSTTRRTAALPRDLTQHGYYVYWDFNEEEDFLASATGQRGQLIPPWDPNGQMCLLSDGSGTFVVGYNPTLASQHNPGSLKPAKEPPVGEAFYNASGHFTGQTMAVPGPYHLPGQTQGGDIPPDANSPSHAFNNNGTYTGCAVDQSDNVFTADLGTAQGSFPVPDNGRLIEWFAPSYANYCILDGPTAGGDGVHHVDGTGGLRQPGLMAFAPNGDLLLPEAGAELNGQIGGRVLRFDHTSFPRNIFDCPGSGAYPPGRLRSSVFLQGSLKLLPFPVAIARDPTCNCWAVDSVFGDPAIAWFDDQGHLIPAKRVIPGQALSQLGKDPNGYNPFGISVAPDGTVYFIDIHIACKNNSLGNCGPVSKGGRLMKVGLVNGEPGAPTPVATGLDFPTNVTICVPGRQFCPTPPGA